MNPESIIKNIINSKRVMQLATSGNYIWACNVHFYSDENLNLYWFSMDSRLHSRHIIDSGKAAATIMIHMDTADEPYVIGISINGNAKKLNNIENKNIIEQFCIKQGKPKSSINLLSSPDCEDHLFTLIPENIVLFDSKHFPTDPRKEINPK